MSKITKKELQRAIQRQESRIDGLVGLLAKKGYYNKEPEPHLKQLDQSDDIVKEPAEVDLSSELTGSELCKAMLARGDKYVLCIVSPYRDAIDNDSIILPKVVTKFHEYGFITTNGKWAYATPVNNKGEPLTSSEVGL